MSSAVPPSPNWQRALFIPLTILAWLAVIVLGGWILTHLVKTILTLIFAGIIAFAITPLVSLLERWLPRGLAIAAGYLIGLGVVLALVAWIIVTAADQVTALVHHLPQYSKQLESLEPQAVRLLHPFGVTKASFVNARHQATDYLQSIGTTAAKDSLSIVTGIVGTIIEFILVLILSIYLTANAKNISARLRKETPGGQRRYTNLLIAIVNQVVGGYIRGQLSLAALVGVLVGGGMWVLHVPYAALLGVLAFFMEFIPIVGVLVSGAVCVLVAFTQGWITAVLVLAYFVVVHVIEGDLVGPRIMGNAVGIHPATAIIALVAATELFGFWGAILGAPLAGLIQAIGTAAWREYRGGDPTVVLQAAQKAAVTEADAGSTPAAE